MSDNVINFPKSDAGRRQHDDAEKLKKHAEYEQNKLHSIEGSAPGKRGHVLNSPRDREVVARILGAQLDEMANDGIPVSALHTGDKTFPLRIERYTLRESGSSKKKSTLLAKLQGYMAIAEAIARVRKKDATELKIAALRGTNFWAKWDHARGTSSQRESEDDHVVKLCDLINKMTASVVKKFSVSKLFKEVDRDEPQHTLLNGPTFKYMEHVDDFLHFPGVPLLRYLHSTYESHTGISTKPLTGHPSRENCESQITSPIATQVKINLWREIHLSIGAIDDKSTAGPLLESRAHIEALIPKETHALLAPTFPQKNKEKWIKVDIFPSNLLVETPAISVGEKWYRLDTDFRLTDQFEIVAKCEAFHWLLSLMWQSYPYEITGDPGDPATQNTGPDYEHWWVTWAPISVASVKYWIANPELPSLTALVEPETAKGGAELATYFNSPRAARTIELAIRTGTLREALIKSVKEYSENFRRRRAERLAQARANDQSLFAEWEKDSIEEQNEQN